jgi:hypothetical protein
MAEDVSTHAAEAERPAGGHVGKHVRPAVTELELAREAIDLHVITWAKGRTGTCAACGTCPCPVREQALRVIIRATWETGLLPVRKPGQTEPEKLPAARTHRRVA